MKHIITSILFLFALAQIATAQVASTTAPAIYSGYGGGGRSVSLRDRGHFTDVRSWASPGVQNIRESIHVFPPVTTYNWWTQGGVLFIRPVGTVSAFDYDLHLYGTTTDAIMIHFPVEGGVFVTVNGLPGSYFFGTWILLPVGSLCSGTITFDGINDWDEIIRFSPVSLYPQ